MRRSRLKDLANRNGKKEDIWRYRQQRNKVARMNKLGKVKFYWGVDMSNLTSDKRLRIHFLLCLCGYAILCAIERPSYWYAQKLWKSSQLIFDQKQYTMWSKLSVSANQLFWYCKWNKKPRSFKENTWQENYVTLILIGWCTLVGKSKQPNSH